MPSAIAPHTTPAVSFIVPARNEEARLGACLASIKAAMTSGEFLDVIGRASFEILVVDDDSEDATADIAQEGGATVIHVAHHQISRVRNSGAKVARGERLIFVDADTVVSGQLLAATLRAFDSGAVAGGAPFRFEGKYSLWHRAVVALTLAVFRVCKLSGGCYFFCTRDAFQLVGGFDEELFASEEIALARALKTHGRFVLLKVSVASSPRKLLDFTPLEVARMLLGQVLRGRRAFKSRDGLEIWYGARRS